MMSTATFTAHGKTSGDFDDCCDDTYDVDEVDNDNRIQIIFGIYTE